MRSNRSRLARFGLLALALCVAVGMATGGVAEAKGKKGKSITVTAAPTTIPAGSAQANSLTSVPFTVGKKAKGKVVGANTVLPTLLLTGPAGFLTGLDLELVSPLGRPVDLDDPFDDETTSFGPVTYSPNSFAFFCGSNLVVPVACANPKHSIMRPYVGTVSDVGLALFTGIAARGTWHLLIVNPHPFAIALALASLRLDLEDEPFLPN